jgi:hypothetical protein
VKVRIEVGEVVLRLDGMDLTPRLVRRLLADAAAIAATLPPGDDEQEPKTPVGFAATIDRRDEVIPKEDLDWYFDE